MSRARQCPRCQRWIHPRGAQPPRYCAVCGTQLAATATAATHPREDRGTSGEAIVGLILAILSILTAGTCLPLGPAAIFLGVHASAQIERGGGRQQGEGIAAAAVILGAIGMLLWLIALFAR